MRITSIILLTLSLVLLTGCVTETTGPQKKKVNKEEVKQKLIDLGVGYLRERDYTRAKENLRKALAIDPNSALAHNTLGILFQLEGDPVLAEQHFKTALSSEPGFSQARNNYGAFLYSEGRFADAIKQLKKAGEDRYYAKRAQVFENMGVAYLGLKDNLNAEQAFQRAIELNYNQPRALIELATIRFQQKNYVEAKKLYERHAQVSQQSARSLWLCVRLARIFSDKDQESSCALVLKNIFPATNEYKLYQQSL